MNIGSGIYPIPNTINVDKYICLENAMKGDIYSLPFEDNYFDTVLALEILEHLDDLRKGIKECYRVLKSKGRFIITIPNYSPNMRLIQDLVWKIRLYTTQRIYLNKIPEHINKRTPQEFKIELMNNNFKIIKMKRIMFYDYLIIAEKCWK